jgi:hypothetical protein
MLGPARTAPVGHSGTLINPKPFDKLPDPNRQRRVRREADGFLQQPSRTLRKPVMSESMQSCGAFNEWRTPSLGGEVHHVHRALSEFRWTKQGSRAASNLEHRASAAWRVSNSTRTRTQVVPALIVVRRIAGS